MRKLLAVVACILLAGCVATFERYEYPDPFSNDTCKTLTESCTCIGLGVAEKMSYPPQYHCSGWETCKDKNVTVCPE